jgi:hypothetical protein
MDVNDFRLMEDILPGSIWGEELFRSSGAAKLLDIDVLNVGAEIGESPGDVVVVSHDDEREAREGDSSDVELAGGGGLEVGLIPDSRNVVREMHVVRE